MEKEEILKKIKEEALENHVPIVEDEPLKVIETILKLKRPNRILEVGTAVGYSAINFSKYLCGENSKLKTIELKESMYNKALENITAMGLNDKIEAINADATEYMKNIPNEEQYDVVFIDAAKGQYLVFLEEAIRLTKVGGVIIADNMLYRGRTLSDYNDHKHRTATNRLREYLVVMEEDERLDSTLIKIGDGLAISIVVKK
ncbi:MAG: O-methyltransferase [Clostridia bacterium]|nr:O-methyltransferase [Clostridia bacterium]